MKALANVQQWSSQNVETVSGTVAQISAEDRQEPIRTVRFTDRARNYSLFTGDSFSRNKCQG